jgi:hypothetical protein
LLEFHHQPFKPVFKFYRDYTSPSLKFEIVSPSKGLIVKNRFIKPFLFLFTLMGFKPLVAQDYSIPKLQASIAYFGELITHPGVKLGINYTLKQKSKIMKSEKQIDKGWLTGANATFFIAISLITKL